MSKAFNIFEANPSLHPSYYEFDDLVAIHGEEKAEILFEEYKTSTKPKSIIKADFAYQIIESLPSGFAQYDPSGTEWRLDNPDSDSCLEWAECHRLTLPNGFFVDIEVTDNNYFVMLHKDAHDFWDNDSLSGWSDIAPIILERYEEATA
jgi:hypothetical protein